MFLRKDPSEAVQGGEGGISSLDDLPVTEWVQATDAERLRREEPYGPAEGIRIISGERQLSSESLEVVFPADRMRSVARLRVVLAQHLDKIFVLPNGRRLPIDPLMDRLASGKYDWAEVECEVCFEESIGPNDADGPWSAPDCAPCWRGMRGPLFHLWANRGAASRRELVGLIVLDQRSACREAQIDALIQEAGFSSDKAGAEPGTSKPRHEIELSPLVVESEYRPALSETDPAILALAMPEGEGWTPGWWKLGMLPQWQYGWSRWK